MNKLTETSRKILRSVFMGVSAAAAALSLTACPPITSGGGWDMYGMPPEYGMPGPVQEEILITGKVISQKTKEPIIGITVYISELNARTYTYNEGNFNYWAAKKDNYTIIFTDIDGETNGGRFKQYTLNLTKAEAEALKETPLIIELEEESGETEENDD